MQQTGPASTGYSEVIEPSHGPTGTSGPGERLGLPSTTESDYPTGGRHRLVPRQRTSPLAEPPDGPDVEPGVTVDPTGSTLDATASTPTMVLPYLGSAMSRRTRRLRAWMLALPVDVAVYLAPLLWTVEYWKGLLFAAGLTVTTFATGGLYRARRHLSILDELPSLFGRLLAAAAVVAIIAAGRHDSVAYVGGFLQVIAVSAALVLIGRAITRYAVSLARRRRWVEHAAIVVGGGPIAIELARLLRRYPQYGLRFVGFIDVESATHTGKDSKPLIGHLDDLQEMIRITESEVVIIADVECPESKLLEVARLPTLMSCDLWVVPRLPELHSQGVIADHIGAIPVTRVRRAGLTGLRWAVKRTADLVVASLALVVLSPLLLGCAIATRIEGGRGVFFRQQRVGRYGQPFDLIKFRTMRPSDDQESQTNWSIANDPRVGPVGRFMRRTSLDELPQLWNIMRGDMTVVGPRPERPFFVDQFSASDPNYAMRHRVPVGLTGLAQVSGLRGDTPISDRARFDNYYIENWSLWLDVKVVLRTLIEVFRGGGR
jgi:exopolysaccharide biosynthesis polyprenyl glycosylphosphotransferase